MTATATPSVVVLGGGFGGLEATFYLRMRLGDQARLTLVSAEDHFLYKPTFKGLLIAFVERSLGTLSSIRNRGGQRLDHMEVWG